MEQLLGAQQQRQQHHQPPRTPNRPHLQHIPSNRFRDHHHPQPHAGLRILRITITPPFFLLLLAAVYLLASFTILSAPAASLRPASNPNRLIVPMPPPSPGLFDLDNGRILARISNVGATVTSLLVPDKKGAPFLFGLIRCLISVLFLTAIMCASAGVLADVVLGFDSLDPYLVSPPCVLSDLQRLISVSRCILGDLSTITVP
jgi:hypothetical protein